MWASFGSGKSHALLHLKWLAEKDRKLLPIYVVIPQGGKSFVDLYRAIVDAAIECDALASAGRCLLTARRDDLGDVGEALRRIAASGAAGARISEAWLRGEKVPMRDLREVGIASRIETVADAVNALNHLVAALQEDHSRTVMFLFDEVQELEMLGRKLEECTGGLHKVFDKNQQGLIFVLSFMTGTQSALRGIIGDPLYERSAMPPLTLPRLDQDEAVELVEGLLRAAAINPSRVPFPFEEGVIDAIIAKIQGELALDLTPRNVIKTFSDVLREADLAIEDGEISTITNEFALQALNAD